MLRTSPRPVLMRKILVAELVKALDVLAEKFVAVRSDGVVAVHAADCAGNYATLCGMDGDDSGADQEPAELPKRPKVNCATCIQIIEHARSYRKSDLTRGRTK